VTLKVTNTGRRTGIAVPEIYLGLPGTSAIPEPPEQLAGFTKLRLAPGRSRTVTIPLQARSFEYWDTARSGWAIMPGCVKVMAGQSSGSLPLHAVLSQGGTYCRAARR
jgi:beta-glucosidase